MSENCCPHCGIEIQKRQSIVTGRVLEFEPNFCRRCGYALASRVDECSEDDLEDDSEFDIYVFENVEELAEIAIPENARELTFEELRKHAVQAIWKRLTGIDPFPNPETEASIAREHERHMQISVEHGIPLRLCLPRSMHRMEECSEDSVKQHHLVWVNGLIRHVSWSEEEVQRYRPIVKESYYMIEPCDCDTVEYIPSEAAPGFLRKA